MAYGNIGHEKNFIYISGVALLDVQSVDYSVSTNRTVLNMAGVSNPLQVVEGVSEATLNLERYVISNNATDPFSDPSLYTEGFSGVWQHFDAAGESRFFAMTTAYVSNYTFSAAVNSVPTVSLGLVAYGSGIGQVDIATGYMTGATDAEFLDAFIYPKQVVLSFPEPNTLSGIVSTNAVESFNISFNMNREVRNRIGQQKKTPETFISYPMEATLTLEIDVDDYSTPAINDLLCQDPEILHIHLRNCNGSDIRSFEFSSGVLQSASMTEEVRNINRATLQYTKYITNDDDFGFWF